jgi:hypothetical protein
LVGACRLDDDAGAVVPEPEDGDVVWAGAFTEKSVPVTTVTSAPSDVGPLARVAVPDSECRTCSASARWLGDE